MHRNNRKHRSFSPSIKSWKFWLRF